MGDWQLTASLTAADSAVGRVLEVASDVADLAIKQALASEVLAVEGLGAPEATGSDGAPLRTLGEGSSGGGVWGDRHASGVGEGSEESRE